MRTQGGRGSKNGQIFRTSFMDGSLLNFQILKIQTFTLTYNVFAIRNLAAARGPSAAYYKN